MKQMEPQLSVIVPAYNCEKYIAECIDSILSQLPENSELIVADDGSEDDTRSVLAQYEGRQENLHILYEAHRGASGARNAGLNAAAGRYAAFVDCDDCLRKGFLEKALLLLESGADLYIFGIERILLDGTRQTGAVEDMEYGDISSFADDYIRKGRMMIYSNCNKFYKRSVIEDLNLRFDEKISFGEDRLFNYSFLPGCRSVVTSSLIMLDYIQRSLHSMSTRHIPFYFDRVMELHQKKMDCFLELSKGTTQEERRRFSDGDLEKEISGAVARASAHPKEQEEVLAKIRRMRPFEEFYAALCKKG